MKIYDISQEVFSCAVFPGNPAPERQVIRSMAAGERNNLTAFSMCVHNGTHVDSPFHFYKDGIAIEEMDLEVFVGGCYVARHDGDVTAADAERILKKADGAERILIAGDATVTAEAAEVFASSNIKLLGNESQTVGPKNGAKAVHLILLGCGIALLEGVVLKSVPEGHYFLSAAPLNLAGSDGAPCRAYLLTR